MLTDFNFNKENLALILPRAKDIDQWYEALCEFLPRYEIDTPRRVASFLAQTSHESGGYTTMIENLNYSAEGLCRTWPSRFKSLEVAQECQRNPEKIANNVYSDRMGNGSEESGEGYLYRGRGLIQLTGKTNYTLFAFSAEIQLVDAPAYLETKYGAVHSACWFWFNNNLNTFADKDDFVGMTKRINGGTNGLVARIEEYKHAFGILNE